MAAAKVTAHVRDELTLLINEFSETGILDVRKVRGLGRTLTQVYIEPENRREQRRAAERSNHKT